MSMQELLLKHCPFIHSLFKKDKRIWRNIDKFRQRFEALIANSNPDQKIPIHCLYDWIASAELGNTKAINFLSFIDETASKVFKQIDSKFHKSLKLTVSEVLTAFDKDVTLKNNPAYLNYIGELIGLQAITDPIKSKFNLLAREYPLPNGSKIDYQFLNLENSQPILVDFFSIHGINLDKILSPNELEEHLIERFNKKLESKTKNLTENLNRIVFKDGSEQMLAILPIIWCDNPKDFKPYSQVFKNLEARIANVLPCCSLIASVDEHGNQYFDFIKLSSL